MRGRLILYVGELMLLATVERLYLRGLLVVIVVYDLDVGWLLLITKLREMLKMLNVFLMRIQECSRLLVHQKPLSL